MRSMVCTVILGPSFERADHQIRQAKATSDIVELRLDYFDDLEIGKLRDLRKMHADIPMIFTLRERAQGGLYQGTEEQRFLDIEQLAHLEPEYFDLEHNIPIPLVDKFTREHPEIRLIFSFHNFEKTPHQLQWISKLMHLVPAAIYKVAAMANSSTDVIRMLRFLKEGQGNLIIATMGELGKNGRILSPVYGNFLTYTSLDGKHLSALGQMPIEEMIETYHFDKLNAGTDVYGLIGNPLDKSPSHITHNTIFRKAGLNAVYVKLPVAEEELEKFCYHARKLGIKGFSVTMPLKEAIIPHITNVSEEAQAIGAVNTLTLRDANYNGDNTDGIGALNALEAKMAVKGKRIVIIGAGGAARAAAYEAIKRGAKPIILNRTVEKAEYLAARFGCEAAPLAESAAIAREGYDIVINGTPSVMPIPQEDILPTALAMDMTITPKKTPFLAAAMKKGCAVVYGLDMFMEQARGQFKLWYSK